MCRRAVPNRLFELCHRLFEQSYCLFVSPHSPDAALLLASRRTVPAKLNNVRTQSMAQQREDISSVGVRVRLVW